ncbi:MAG: hypothetical protein LLG04_15360 [Parachlamydia sp.]|nr:hypothetical protein [Parachlamydia sp.]
MIPPDSPPPNAQPNSPNPPPGPTHGNKRPFPQQPQTRRIVTISSLSFRRSPEDPSKIIRQVSVTTFVSTQDPRSKLARTYRENNNNSPDIILAPASPDRESDDSEDEVLVPETP